MSVATVLTMAGAIVFVVGCGLGFEPAVMSGGLLLGGGITVGAIARMVWGA